MTFTLYGRWILARVTETDGKGFIQTATNHAGVVFKVQADLQRSIIPATYVGGKENAEQLVYANRARGFGTLDAVVEEVKKWRPEEEEPDADVGEQILENLT